MMCAMEIGWSVVIIPKYCLIDLFKKRRETSEYVRLKVMRQEKIKRDEGRVQRCVAV